MRVKKLRLLSKVVRYRKRIATVIRVTLFVHTGRLLTLSAEKVNGQIAWSYEVGPAAGIPSEVDTPDAGSVDTLCNFAKRSSPLTTA